MGRKEVRRVEGILTGVLLPHEADSTVMSCSAVATRIVAESSVSLRQALQEASR